jgi:hypothetical protein
MRYILATALVGAALVAAPGLDAQQSSRTSGSLERDFAGNGKISMDLSAGDYRITGTADKKIRLAWTIREEDRATTVVAGADIRGSEARIVTDGPMNHFRVSIEVPQRSDLYIRLTAGELRLDRVEGSKDVELHAGEMRIDVNRATDYRTVDASIWAGEIHAAPFNVHKEGLFRSFDWRGTGAYTLHARLKAGEMRLSESLPKKAERESR